MKIRINIVLKSVTNQYAESRYVKTGETVERQSKDPNDSSSRFDATDSVVKIYKDQTPGQSKETTGQTIKRVLDKTERKNK
jgi:hypothetical protein